MQPRVEEIIRIVAEYYEVTPSEITGRRRLLHVVFPRHICMYLIRDLTKRSFHDVALAVGCSDHTTAISAINSIARQAASDERFRSQLLEIADKISITTNNPEVIPCQPIQRHP